jgi:hypothetical protein
MCWGALCGVKCLTPIDICPRVGWIVKNIKDGRGARRLPDHLVRSRTAEWASGERQVSFLQIPHDAARRTNFPEFPKDQLDARLHFFIRIQDHFSTRLAS